MAKSENHSQNAAKEIYSNLTPYQITQLSRHPSRPYTLDIINQLCSEFIELHGDRGFMDDKSIVAGLAIFKGQRVVVVGHQKGRGTKENIFRNFGMPKPEGYRKALRVMELAERFNLPILSFIDTPGAYPGIDAEERGQSEAIARNILVMSRLTVPIITTVVGEGGSGGALAIGVGNRNLMLSFSTYSVISPEGCASILWKDVTQKDRAAKILGLTAPVALKNKLIDEIIPEPEGGAHTNSTETIVNIGNAIEKNLSELLKLSRSELKQQRIAKYFAMGQFKTMPPISPFRSEKPVEKQWEKPWSDIATKFHLSANNKK